MKLRFNLGKKNYKKWQISDGKKRIYLDPSEVTLKLYNCNLHNNPKVAKDIFNGKHKTVCSWIKCDKIEILKPTKEKGKLILYNPRVKPYWHDEDGNNIDKNKYSILFTRDNKVYEPKL